MRPLGWALIQSDWYPHRKKKYGDTKETPETSMHRRPHEDTVGRPPSVRQAERPEKKPNLLTS